MATDLEGVARALRVPAETLPAGHMLPLEQPGVLAARIRAFAATLEPPAAAPRSPGRPPHAPRGEREDIPAGVV
jgi:hypothetical protein